MIIDGYMVSVIILSYNTVETTLKCLEFLYLSTFKDFEVILVDNASKDGTVEAVQNRYKDITILRNEDNVGFAAGNNQAMAAARGGYILLLNSDCFVFFDTIEKAQSSMIDAHCDVLGCRLLNSDGTGQPSWGYFPTLRRIFQMMIFVDNLPVIRDMIDSIHVRSEMRYARWAGVDWVTGAFVMLKREVWEKVGGIDEKYFMYGEEMEWMFRIKKAGFKIGYSPIPQAVHLMGASSPDRSPAVVGEMKGWIYWFSKHNPAWQQKLLPFIVRLGCILRILVRPKMAEYYKKALKEI